MAADTPQAEVAPVAMIVVVLAEVGRVDLVEETQAEAAPVDFNPLEVQCIIERKGGYAI